MSSAHLAKFDSVKPASIEWRNELPFSLEFNDVYFSADGGIAESDHVFINGTKLLGDWQNESVPNFTIAELGFGTGLNFLNTARHWQRHQSNTVTKQSLHYLSIEKRPLLLNDFKRALNCWPEFSDISQRLIEEYPSPTFGRFQINFPKIRLTLTLLFMPVENALEDLSTESKSRTPRLKVSHWFLDGFSPAKNQSMWAKNVFEQIALLSNPGTKLATFSVASAVKTPLKNSGFEITKQKGFAKKREMLTAVFKPAKNNSTSPKYINLKFDKPWFNIKCANSEKQKNQKIAIIGGGIAGCTLAYTLSNSYNSITLYESEASIATKASGAAAGIFHPQLTTDLNLASQFSWQAYLSLINLLTAQPAPVKDKLFISLGLERFLKDKNTKNELLSLVNQYHLTPWITDLDNQERQSSSIFYPGAGAIDIAELSKFYMDKAVANGLILENNSQVNSLDKINDGWQLSFNNKTESFQHVIFCGGANSPVFERFANIPTNTSRGQTCYLSHSDLLQSLSHAICEQVYLVPSKSNQLHIGSTFDDFTDDQLQQRSQTEILMRASKFLKANGLGELSENSIISAPVKGNVGYRLHSLDRLPLVGAAFDVEKLSTDFGKIGQKKIAWASLSNYNQAGLWLNTAYGSHGLLYSLLCSQHLSSLISNDWSPLSKTLSNAINPARFLIKSFK